MSVAVWKTGHEIADTVAKSLLSLPDAKLFDVKELSEDKINSSDVHIAYGILRGTADVFNLCDKLGKPWFNVDRGYLKPSHYDGYYRISLRGTQYMGGFDDWLFDATRFNQLGINLETWRGIDKKKPVLICPPSHFIKGFFPTSIDWLNNALQTLEGMGINRYIVRAKGESDTSPEQAIKDSNYVVTYNSAMGWQALQMGVPVISDPQSLAGRFQCFFPPKNEHRKRLFCLMANLQFTLKEIREGMLWPIMNKML